mgnify:CR=1 FL=1
MGLLVAEGVDPSKILYYICAMRDTFIRLSFRTLQKHTATLQELNGSHLSEKDQEGSS